MKTHLSNARVDNGLSDNNILGIYMKSKPVHFIKVVIASLSAYKYNVGFGYEISSLAYYVL